MTMLNSITKNEQPKGKLFYVIGASGVGKDSLMRYARQQLESTATIFAHRYITRPLEINGENHVQLSNEEFNNRLDRGCFKFHWQAHGLSYGIGIEVDIWLNNGLNVVINGSRAYLDTAVTKHPSIIPILIQVNSSLLRKRLISRGRENPEQIEQRILRAESFAELMVPNMLIIENNDTISSAGNQLVDLLKSRIEV